MLKNGFEHVVLGLSGGIDSALVACLAADALRPEAVSTAIMPSRYSSAETQGDAHALAEALGIAAVELPIEPMVDAYAEAMRGQLAEADTSLTQENLQARIRGNMLMALSNEFGWLVLTTGNKSEMSVGYTTLYGDLAGGFAVIKDVPKTLVYRLCRWRNSPDFFLGEDFPKAAMRAVQQPIPPSIIERAPSAELRDDQRDDDSLPPYPVLDEILQGYVELDLSREQLIAQGLPEQDVDRAIALVDLAEYKRRQAPPGSRSVPAPSAAIAGCQSPIATAARPHVHETRAMRAPRLHRAPLLAPVLALALLAGGCGNTIPVQAIPHNQLESMIVAPFRVYWLGASFRGLTVQQVSHDPGGAFSVQYGGCLTGGQGTCLPPLLVVSSPENTFVPGGSARTRQVQVRGLPALEAHGGRVVMIPSGNVVIDIIADTPSWPARRPATWSRSTPPGHPAKPCRPHVRPKPSAGARSAPRSRARCARCTEARRGEGRGCGPRSRAGLGATQYRHVPVGRRAHRHRHPRRDAQALL